MKTDAPGSSDLGTLPLRLSSHFPAARDGAKSAHYAERVEYTMRSKGAGPKQLDLNPSTATYCRCDLGTWFFLSKSVCPSVKWENRVAAKIKLVTMEAIWKRAWHKETAPKVLESAIPATG